MQKYHRNDFDLIAPFYLAMELFLAGPVMQQARVVWLEEIAAAKKVLILGQGRSRFLEKLLESNAVCEVTVIEKSARMIELSRHRLERLKVDLKRVHFLNIDTVHWQPQANEFDAIATHFFLDCFTQAELEKLIPSLVNGLTSGGKWLMAEFRIPERGFKRLRALVLLKMMYLFFRRATRLSANWLPSIPPLLEANGLSREQSRLFNLDFITSDLWVKN